MTTFMKFAANTPLSEQAQGTLPDMSGALESWLQTVTFGVVTTENVAGDAVQEMTEISFKGVMQPLSGRRLEMKPEGQRAWNWWWCHAPVDVKLQVDSIVTWKGEQTRVMSRKDYSDYDYVEYELVQGWIGSGPEVIEP